MIGLLIGAALPLGAQSGVEARDRATLDRYLDSVLVQSEVSTRPFAKKAEVYVIGRDVPSPTVADFEAGVKGCEIEDFQGGALDAPNTSQFNVMLLCGEKPRLYLNISMTGGEISSLYWGPRPVVIVPAPPLHTVDRADG